MQPAKYHYKNDARAHSISTEDTSEGTYHIRMRLKVGRNFDENNLDADMTMSEDVISYSWE